MKALLMHRDRDFDPQAELPDNEPVLAQDLELHVLWRAMAGDDEFLFDVARKTMLGGLQNDVDTVLYRQGILRDCLRHPAVIRELYDLVVETLEKKKRHWFGIFRLPGGILHSSVDLLQMFMDTLEKLRDIARTESGRFESEGFRTLFAMLERELSDEYLARVRHHLAELKFRHGVLLSAELDEGNAGTNYVLRRARGQRPGWFRRLLGQGPPAYTYRLHERDEAGARILSELRDRGLNAVANAAAQSTDHVLNFFLMLRTELGYYVGCLNLHDRLAAKGEPVCFPVPLPAGERRQRFRGLYDPCLSLRLDQRVVGNAVAADGKSLVIITGANQGGKSSFLRAIGLAQLMMQAGLFVAAEAFEAELCTGLFTHYKREEDATLEQGKLDEELARMSDIADRLRRNALLLCNESFAATNEREGSEIARQIVRALLESGIKVFFVTHLYEFAHDVHAGKTPEALFLRAERRPDGTRSFKLVEGEPLETSYGEDLYREIFEAAQAGRAP
jgi:hypothetical protein